MNEGLKTKGNLASHNVLLFGPVLSAVFGFFLVNNCYQHPWISQRIEKPLIEATIIIFAASAVANNRLRIARGEKYTLAARLMGIMAGVLGLLCLFLSGWF